VSADPTPWQIADIGDVSGKTFISVTNDYTYKINAPSGYIGDDSDSFGYVYQQFTGDNRIYYRSRMQSASQFGIMLRSSLDDDADMYWFGGEYNAVGTEKLTYDLKHRSSGKTTIDYTLDNQQANLYFIAEKAGDTLNIYQTENGSTVYTTKNLLASIDCSNLGDTYYMGFAATYGGSNNNPPDAGWVSIDNNGGDDSYTWNFDYGLDWLWQMQESNVLAPSWCAEAPGNNGSGAIVIKPDENYTSDRYIFREYITDDSLMPEMSARVYASGEKPAMNVYFQTGDTNSAYKVVFADEKIIANGNELADFAANSWYSVNIRADVTEDGERAYLSIEDESGTIIDNEEIEAVTGTEFRTQNNVAKKTPVTKAVYFEPSHEGEGTYYIDDVTIKTNEPSVKITKLESWYTFDSLDTSSTFPCTVDGTTELKGSEVSGEAITINGGTVGVNTKDKSIAGLGFRNKLRIKGTAQTITVPVAKGAEVAVYAASASSSASRPLYIDGTEYMIQAADKTSITYEGDSDSIVIYAGDNIDVYGISVTQTIIE
jgi:hypothetical protein